MKFLNELSMGWLLPVHTMTCTWTGQVYWFYFKVGVTANTLTIMTSLIKILLVHIEIPDDIPTTPWYMYLRGDNCLFVFFFFLSPFSHAFSLSCLFLSHLSSSPSSPPHRVTATTSASIPVHCNHVTSLRFTLPTPFLCLLPPLLLFLYLLLLPCLLWLDIF